jgi:hypothetical protein
MPKSPRDPAVGVSIGAFAATADELRQVYDRAAGTEAAFSIYTSDLFATPHDDANRAAVRAHSSDALPLVGMACRGPKKVMDRILKGLRLHS